MSSFTLGIYIGYGTSVGEHTDTVLLIPHSWFQESASPIEREGREEGKGTLAVGEE